MAMQQENHSSQHQWRTLKTTAPPRWNLYVIDLGLHLGIGIHDPCHISDLISNHSSPPSLWPSSIGLLVPWIGQAPYWLSPLPLLFLSSMAQLLLFYFCSWEPWSHLASPSPPWLLVSGASADTSCCPIVGGLSTPGEGPVTHQPAPVIHCSGCRVSANHHTLLLMSRAFWPDWGR